MLPSCCACGHIDVFHAIRGNGSRGACSISAGAKAVPCGCAAFTAAPAVQAATDAAAEGIDPKSASAESTELAGLSRTSPEVPDAS
jgi:hypothetical protein